VIGKIFEAVLVLGKYTRRGVPGEPSTKTADCGTGAPAHSFRTLGIMPFQFGQALLQPKGVELTDRKNSNAALCTARATRQPGATPAYRVLECGIDDLQQLTVSAPK
jgi:hypothetical protein